MSVKIKVSYTDEQELGRIVRLLSTEVKSWKSNRQRGNIRGRTVRGIMSLRKPNKT